MSSGELFLKSVTVIFTGFFLIVSIAFILYGLAASFYLLKTNTTEILDQELVAVSSISLILCGCFLFLVIIIGWCAIYREIPCCLETYCVFLFMLAASQFCLGVFSLIRFNFNNVDFRMAIDDSVRKTFENYYEDPTQQLANTQQWMECCGYSGPTDWLTDRAIPSSCCEGNFENCTFNSENLFKNECSFTLYSFIIYINYNIGLALIITAITELVAAVMGIGLSCAFWRNSRVMWI